MQGFLGKQIRSSFFHEQCLTSSGKFMPFIHPDEAWDINKSCYNPHRFNIVTCNDRNIQAFLDEVGGLDLDLQLHSKIEGIPPYIPILDYTALCNYKSSLNPEYLGITLKDVIQSGFIYKAGRIHESSKIEYHSTLLNSTNLKNKKVILFLSGEDTIIEGVWHKRDPSYFFETLMEMGFYAVAGFNFSLFGGECPFSHALNLKKSLFSSYLLEKNGLKTIPHVYALNQFHINRWIDWFKQNPTIKYFTTNCQLQKPIVEIEWTLFFISQLLKEIPWLHVILQGFVAESLLRFETTIINRIHLTNKKPVKCAMGQKKFSFFTEDNNLIIDACKPIGITKSYLIDRNITEYYNYIKTLLSR